MPGSYFLTRRKRVFLMSNFNYKTAKKISEMIKYLGAEVTELADNFTATHLVTPCFSPTRKMMAALAAGIWVVHTSYVINSYERGKWLLESKYEIGYKSPSLNHSEDSVSYPKDILDAPRLRREMSLIRNRPNLSNWKVGLVMDDEYHLRSTMRILKAGGAFVLPFTLPLGAQVIDWADSKSIQFFIAEVADIKFVASLKDLQIPIVSYSYLVDYLFKDPAPGISRYDFFLQAKNDGKCSRTMKNTGWSVNNSLDCKEDDLSFEAGSSNNDVYLQSEEEFHLIFNGSHNFLTNKRVCVTLNINHQINPEEEEKEKKNLADEKITNVQSILQSRSLDCYERPEESEYLPQNLCKVQNNVNATKKDTVQYPYIGSRREMFSSQFSTKRKFCPRNEMSPSKRSKKFTPQNNKISRYFVKANKHCENVKSENNGKYCKKELFDITNDSKLSNVGGGHNDNKGENYCDNSHCLPEVIVISSDDESDTSIDTTIKYNEEIVSVQNNLSKEINCGVDMGNVRKNCDINRSIVNHKQCLEEEIRSCNETNKMCFKSARNDVHLEHHTIDLTQDDNSDDTHLDHHTIDLSQDDNSDYARAVQDLENEQFKSDLIMLDCMENDNLYKLESVSEHCEKICRVQMDKRIEEESDSKIEIVYIKNMEDAYDNIDEKCFSVHKNTGTSSEDKACDHSLHPPPSLSCSPRKTDLKSFCLINSHDYCFLESDQENETSDARVEESNISDSSLPSPPRFVNKYSCQGGENPIVVCDVSRNTENNGDSGDKCIEFQKQNGDKCCFKSGRAILPNIALPMTTSNSDEDCQAITSSFSKCTEIIPHKHSQSENNTNLKCSEKNSKNSPLQSSKKNCVDVIKESKNANLKISALQVYLVQSEVFLSKLYQPWIHLDFKYVSKCCKAGIAECNALHGNKKASPEEADYGNENLILSMDSGLSAVDLLQGRIDSAKYPSSISVQFVLLCCMDTWRKGVPDALFWLYQLLEEYPPCAFAMLDYYKQIFFNSVPNFRVSDGIFWQCVMKIEEIMFVTPNEHPADNSDEIVVINSNTNDSGSACLLDKYCDTANVSPDEEQNLKSSVKLKHLFIILDYLISVMEADLGTGLLKNVTNLKRYVCKSSRPLIAVALWGKSGTSVGKVNEKCRYLMKMYFKIFALYYNTGYFQSIKRLISLMAGTIYASEWNEEAVYPNIGCNCKEFANTFVSFMMTSELNMTEVGLVLNSLRPDWFCVCVCFNILEKLYGRNMEISLKPIVALLEDLTALNFISPREEEIAVTFLSDPDINKDSTQESIELPENFVKNANKKDSKGETRLHRACRNNKVGIVNQLLCVPGINVNEKDNLGWAPLHEAACKGHVDCIEKLLNFRIPSGAPAVDIHAKNHFGITPLMDAVYNKQLNVVIQLLRYGGPDLLLDKDINGKSALDIAYSLLNLAKSEVDTAFWEHMIDILRKGANFGEENLPVEIPRTLFIKLSVLTPLAIVFYIQFSEVTKIANNLKTNTTGTKDVIKLFKFHPVAFKRDYQELRKLQVFLQENLDKNNWFGSLGLYI